MLLDDETDRACARAIETFRAAPDNVDQALATARLLFATADLTVQRALVAAAEALPSPEIGVVLALEDRLPTDCGERVLALATAGAEAAQAAVDAIPLDADVDTFVEANVLLAQHLSFVAWANGPMRSLMAGYGPRIEAAMRNALERDSEWNHGAPLRLRGRFLAEAPWPLRDRDESLRLLQRATERFPLAIHHLFLGDLLHDRGEPERAIEQWRAVDTAETDATTASIAPLHRRLAAVRLAAVRADD